MSECYTSGGDALFELAPPKIIGQTFSPLVDHKLEFIDLNLRRWGPGGVITATLYDLAADPDMIGGGIARTKAVDWPPRMFWEVNRVRFKMSSVTLHPDHTYGILVRSDPAPWWNYHYVQYDAAGATYPRGQRFTKDGILDPPTYYPDSDLIFAEFGTPVAPPIPPNPPPEPPPVPPDPPIQNWLIINSAQERTLTGEKITIYTNVPCHLWMRYTLINPKIHKITRLRRGRSAMEDWYFCFDVYTDNDQEEAGDTLVHTFIKEPWPYCEERWYYFHGNVNGIPSPSTSPIFYKHPLLPQPTNDCQRVFNGWKGFCQSWNACAQLFQPDHDYTAKAVEVLLSKYQITRKGPLRILIQKQCVNCWECPVLWSHDFHSDDLPDPEVETWTRFTIPNLPLTAGQNYILVVHTLPGWLGWDGKKWKSWEAGAAIIWAYWSHHQQVGYPRGSYLSGCNFQDSSGSWKKDPDSDATFCILA